MRPQDDLEHLPPLIDLTGDRDGCGARDDDDGGRQFSTDLYRRCAAAFSQAAEEQGLADRGNIQPRTCARPVICWHEHTYTRVVGETVI